MKRRVYIRGTDDGTLQNQWRKRSIYTQFRQNDEPVPQRVRIELKNAQKTDIRHPG